MTKENEITVEPEITTEQSEERTFTQAEVDAIVGDRLKRERAKYTDFETLKAKAAKFDEMEEANKTELQKAIERGDALQKQLDYIKNINEIRDIRTKVAEEAGLPLSLITEDTEDACKAQAEAIKAYANPGYPKVRDAGEVTNTKGTSTREQFKDWLNQIQIGG